MIVKQTEFIKSAVKPDQYPEAVFPEIAFAGRSNVGKSSLINVLVNRKNLVKTSGKPGCTQLVNFFTVNNALSIVDLPGYGYAKVSKTVRSQWGPMVQRYMGNRENLRGVFLLVDIRRTPGQEEMELSDWLSMKGIPCHVVLTKADKLSKNGRQKSLAVVSRALGKDPRSIVAFSTTTRLGRDALWEIIDGLIATTTDGDIMP
ncbi:MAG: ribosome biogenesis GTP-binding protein YihA/YsxC [Pseudomonadota bacterium]